MKIENKVQLILADLSLKVFKATEALQLGLDSDVKNVDHFIGDTEAMLAEVVRAEQLLAKFQSLLQKPEDAQGATDAPITPVDTELVSAKEEEKA